MLRGGALLQRLSGAGAGALAAARLAACRAPAPARRRAGAAGAARAYSEEPAEPGADSDSMTYVANELRPDYRNSVVVTGNVGSALELRRLPNGGFVGSLRLAVPRGKQKTSWFDVDLFSPLADEASELGVASGSRITVHGFLVEDTWIDRMTNQKRSRVKIVAKSLGILPRSGRAPQTDPDNPDAEQPGGSYGYDAPPSPPSPPPPQQQQQQQQQQPYQQQQPQQPPPQQQPQEAYSSAGYGAALPVAPANEIEGQWLSVINEPEKWWDNRTKKQTGKFSAKSPDFSTKEKGGPALWITSKNTPAWVLSNLPPPPAV